jgi:hypothetical protein
MWQVALVEVKFVTVGSVGAVVLAATRTACDDRLDRALTDADTADAQTVAPPHYSHLNALVMAANLVVTYGMTRDAWCSSGRFVCLSSRPGPFLWGIPACDPIWECRCWERAWLGLGLQRRAAYGCRGEQER